MHSVNLEGSDIPRRDFLVLAMAAGRLLSLPLRLHPSDVSFGQSMNRPDLTKVRTQMHAFILEGP